MLSWKHVLVLATAGLIAGCGTTFLHSASGPEAAIRDPGLAGEWTTTGPTITHAVIGEPRERAGASGDGGSYMVAITVQHEGETKTSLALELTLTEIGGARYADLFLARSERDRLVGTYGFLAVPVHQVMKVSREDDELRVWTFNGSWLEGTANGGMFSHDRITIGGGEVELVTAPTDQLRELIARHGNDAAAFGDPMVFRRVLPHPTSGTGSPAKPQ